jgi:hypothetical protein
MVKKVISYKLTNGSIPDYVEDGGYLPNHTNNTSNMILIGISQDGADTSSAEAEFTNETDLLNYAMTYLSNTTVISPITNEQIALDVPGAVNTLFMKLTD